MGISASKLSAYNAFLVGQKEAEFEPTFGLCRMSGGWNRGGFIGSDTISIAGSINWRMTYGLFENLELGLNVLSDASYGNFSLKTKVYETGAFALGAMGGMGIPLGSRAYAHSDPTIDDVSNYAIGLIFSYALDSLTSVDFNVQYQDYFREVYQTFVSDPGPFPGPPQVFRRRMTGSTIYLNADVGCYVVDDEIQLVLGAGYQTSVIDDFWTANLFLESGISMELSNNFDVVLGVTQSIWGQNSQRTTAIGLSFTTFWN